jgi:glycosyltransferase involved in cell wall biosynthesis
VKVLQLTSDWKWTGPAAPMLQLLLALRERGVTVELACPEGPEGALAPLAERARAVGAEPVLALSRDGGARSWGDAWRLRELLEADGYDVVHAWHSRDHVLAMCASAPRRKGATRVVRSYRRAERIPRLPWNRWLFGPGADALLCVSPRTAELNRPLRGGRPIVGAFGAVDLERFTPRSDGSGLRRHLGLRPEHRVVGIAARVQPRRRFDLLLAAMARLARRDARARLLVLGRGTHRRTAAVEPAVRLGIRDRVIFAGHLGDDYADGLRAIDVFTLLVPGSDGGCRALLEAAACGRPSVTTRRGALPEIVLHGQTGLVVDEDPQALCEAWSALLGDARRRAVLGCSARLRAERCFSPARLADEVEGLYRAAAAGSAGRSKSSR